MCVQDHEGFNSTHFRNGCYIRHSSNSPAKITCLEPARRLQAKQLGPPTGIVSQRVTLRAWILKNSSKFSNRTYNRHYFVDYVLAISLNMDVGVKCWGPNDPISVKVGEGPWRFPTKVLRSPMSVVEHILGMSFWKGLSHKHKEYDV